MANANILTLLQFFLLLKTVQLAILLLPLPSFDNSQDIYPLTITSNTLLNGALQKLIRWDAVYFSSLFVNGPQYEHEWVFGPLWVRLVRLASIPSLSPVLMGIIYGNILHWISVILLYYLTMRIYGSKFALRTAVLFICSPQGIFMTAPYSENLATTASLVGLLCRSSRSTWVYLLSSIAWTCAFWTRSNSIVLGVIYVYDLLVQRRPIALLSGIVLGVGSLGSLYPPYASFCPGRPWCEDLIPSLYGYAQSHYWNVGLFKYWTAGNIPNFLFGAPVIVLQILAIRRYWNEHRALCLSNLIFLLMILCVAHVQIVIRVSGFIPLSYWYLSEEVGHARGQGWVLYSVGWSVLGAVLYSCFLPPA